MPRTSEITEIPRNYHPQTVIEKRALRVVSSICNGQMRAEPERMSYITHAENTALLLQKAGEKPATVASGLLHVVLKQASPRYGQGHMRNDFGYDITSAAAETLAHPLVTNPIERDDLRLYRIETTQNLAVVSILAATYAGDLAHVIANYEQIPWNELETDVNDQLLKYQIVFDGLSRRQIDHPLTRYLGSQVVLLERVAAKN